MTIAKSLATGKTLDVTFPDEGKTLDMADKYDSSYFPDDEPTVKIQVPTFHNQVVVSECSTEEDYEHEETRYPGVGLLLALGTGVIFWGTIAYLVFH